MKTGTSILTLVGTARDISTPISVYRHPLQLRIFATNINNAEIEKSWPTLVSMMYCLKYFKTLTEIYDTYTHFQPMPGNFSACLKSFRGYKESRNSVLFSDP